MATEVIMPQMGESIFEGTITKWLKKVGDPVEKDEPLFEISTDKVDAEIPSPVAGVLSEIRVSEGATVGINTVVAVVGDAGEAETAAPAGAGAAENVASDSAGGTDVVMPQMGESIFEGTITKWLKKAGDAVAKDEPLFEISTDKVDAEIPAPMAGVLTSILVTEGSTVGINTVVARIGGSGQPDAKPECQAPVKSAAPVAAPVPAPVTAMVAEPGVEGEAEASSNCDKVRSSPLVRRIAREHNLDLHKIAGTGSGGRITKDDALAYLAKRGNEVATAEPAAATTAKVAAPPLLGQLAPLSRMRSIIAQRMVESTQISPHVHTVFKIDMTRVVKVREREKAKYEQRNGVKLTYMPFIATAAIHTLRKFPIVNASMESTASGEAIRYHANIHLGIAVALEWGLIVPVIKNAEERNFLGLARAVADLAERARGKKLKPDEASGSTFTLTNSGIFGEEFGTPIINQPESAILAIGGLKKEAVVLTDSEGNDTIGIRWMQHFCLGFDHRTIDGADAGKFMAEFKKALEEWSGDIG